MRPGSPGAELRPASPEQNPRAEAATIPPKAAMGGVAPSAGPAPVDRRVLGELRKIGIIAGALFVILVIIALIWR